jgi:hypothetical protein
MYEEEFGLAATGAETGLCKPTDLLKEAPYQGARGAFNH